MATYTKNDVMRFDSLSTDKYRQLKIRILQNDFYIKLSKSELAHFDDLTTDHEIERYFFSIIDRAFTR